MPSLYSRGPPARDILQEADGGGSSGSGWESLILDWGEYYFFVFSLC